MQEHDKNEERKDADRKDKAESREVLMERIRHVEARIARRDGEFLRELDAVTADLRKAGRQVPTVLLVGGAAVAGALVLSGRRPRDLRRLPEQVRHAVHAPVARARARGWLPQVPFFGRRRRREHSRGWFALVLPFALPFVTPMLPAAWRQPFGNAFPVPPYARLPYQGLQWWLGRRRADAAAASPVPVAPANRVDPQRYAGEWIEFARLEGTAKDADVRTFVFAQADGTMRVHRRCVDRNGRDADAHGTIKPRHGTGDNRLMISFAPKWLRWLPMAWKEYWVVHVDAGYRHALVGSPDRRDLRIVARTPTIDRSVLQELVEHAQAQGFDVARLRRSPRTVPAPILAPPAAPTEIRPPSAAGM